MNRYTHSGLRKRLMIVVWIGVLMLALLFTLAACTSGAASPGGSGTPAPTTAPGGY